MGVAAGMAAAAQFITLRTFSPAHDAVPGTQQHALLLRKSLPAPRVSVSQGGRPAGRLGRRRQLGAAAGGAGSPQLPPEGYYYDEPEGLTPEQPPRGPLSIARAVRDLPLHLARLGAYLAETAAISRQLHRPGLGSTLRATGLVLLVVAAFAGLVWGVDAAFSSLARLYFR